MESLPPFTLDDLHPDISQDAKNAICDVILQFARLDALISHFLFVAFHLSVHDGPIIAGNMDTRGKLDRLKRLYEHHGMKSAAASIGNLKEAHAHWVDLRNSIAHSTCAGSRTSNPNMIVFAPVAIEKGALETIPVDNISVEGMRQGSLWAKAMGDLILTAIAPLTGRPAKPPPEPPYIRTPRRPSQQTSVGGKKKPRPPRVRGKRRRQLSPTEVGR